MSERKFQILQYIIETFIHNPHPVSSGAFENNKDFSVSSATIRNEMAKLEKEGFLIQPHTSAGRIPSSKGYKKFVSTLTELPPQQKDQFLKEFKDAQEQYYIKIAKEKVYDAISILSTLSENIAFATIPKNRHTLFLGVSKLLNQPEFHKDIDSAMEVIEVIENGFFEVLDSLQISNNKVDIHVGESDIFPQFDSCSVLCIRYNHYGFEGVIGIVGPLRMDYSRNKAFLEHTKYFIEGQKLLS